MPVKVSVPRQNIEIFHVADIHIGQYRWVRKYLEKRTKPMLDGIIAAVEASRAAFRVVVIAGDLYEREDLREEERILGVEFVARLAKIADAVILLNGNHDFYNEQGLTLLQTFGHFATMIPGLHVVLNNPGVVSITAPDSVVLNFACLPCVQKRDSDDFLSAVRALKPAFAAGDETYNYVVMHEAVAGSVACNGQPLRSNLHVVEEDDIDGYLLGDIHKRQQIGPKTWYCGSPCQMKRDEDPDSGLLVWTPGVVEPRYVPVNGVPRFVKAANREELAAAVAAGDIVQYTGTDVKEDDELSEDVVVVPEVAPVDIQDEVDQLVNAGAEAELIAGIPEYLAAKGKDEAAQRRAVERIRGYVSNLGIV